MRGIFSLILSSFQAPKRKGWIPSGHRSSQPTIQIWNHLPLSGGLHAPTPLLLEPHRLRHQHKRKFEKLMSSPKLSLS
jgi:hypothetical protein